jgi:phage repressor protein C with HTH and peptisase S24 domain
MGFYTSYIEALQRGEQVSFRPSGNSMTPRIHSRDLVTIQPIPDHTTIREGDAVLCKVNGNIYVHKVYAIDGRAPELRFQIGNNHGHINGWTWQQHVYGKLIKVEK